jgi:molybdopterin-guanine dinucleotide biosynthesis protein A
MHHYFQEKFMSRANLLILAAGKSSRMGQSKADLNIEGQKIVELHAESFKKYGATYLVMGKHNFKEFEGVTSLINPFAPDCSPFESLQYGLSQLKEMALPTFVLPVDFLPMPTELWEPMLDELRRDFEAVIPSFEGKHGHPVLLSCKMQKSIKNQKEGRLDHILNEAQECSILELEFPQIHKQFNTKEEFSKLTSTAEEG